MASNTFDINLVVFNNYAMLEAIGTVYWIWQIWPLCK